MSNSLQWRIHPVSSRSHPEREQTGKSCVILKCKIKWAQAAFMKQYKVLALNVERWGSYVDWAGVGGWTLWFFKLSSTVGHIWTDWRLTSARGVVTTILLIGKYYLHVPYHPFEFAWGFQPLSTGFRSFFLQKTRPRVATQRSKGRSSARSSY